MKNKLCFILLSFLFFSCSSEKEIIKIDDLPKSDTLNIEKIEIKSIKTAPDDKNEFKAVKLGIDVLKENGFEILKNKRIGLITNQTGVDKQLNSTVDIFHESAFVNLSALYGPEHGVRGDIEGGEFIDFYNDKKTGLPVYSLYGKTRKPSPQMLKGIDVLVYDIQDIGVRSYTFISTMGLAMEAASENNIEFIILDRPNPLGGRKIEGNIVEENFISFISQFPIPYVYGLTCGELANMLIKEKMIETSKDFKLTIIPMENWQRDMRWEDTGLEWTPTSPHIPQAVSSYSYPMTGIMGELRSSISVGVGYTLPFQIVGAEWINPHELTDELKNLNIPGLSFMSITYKPYYAFGKEKTLHGVQLFISDYSAVNLTKTQFYIMSALKKLYPHKDLLKLATRNEIKMFNKAIGTDRVTKILDEGTSIDEVLEFLDKDAEKFRALSEKYYIY